MLPTTQILPILVLLLVMLSPGHALDETLYSGSVDTYRLMVRAQTQVRINTLNEKYGQYYTSGHNLFSELTPEEFAATYCGGKMSPQGSIQRNFVAPPTFEQKITLKNSNNNNLRSKPLQNERLGLDIKANSALLNILPTNGVFSVDYSLSNNLLITPVKNQGACGSCWAFCGIAQIQSYFMKKHKIMLDLSEQQMVDCVGDILDGTDGCGGGLLDSVQYYAAQFPVAQEKFYPYTATNGTCTQDKISYGRTFRIKSYSYIYGCIQLASFLLTMGPVPIAAIIDIQWQSYISGVIPNCKEKAIGGHGVQIVGVFSDGTQNTNTNYWKIKNSWGIGYGMNGFLNVYRDYTDTTTGLCSLCNGVYSI